MRVPNNEIIQHAINQAVDHYGSQVKLAELSGIRQNDISRYIKGEHKNISAKSWGQLYQFIEQFLPDNYVKDLRINDDESDRSINIIGYNHGTIVVHSIAGLTTAKEIKTDLTNKILASTDLDDHTKLKVIKLINMGGEDG